MTEVEVWIRLYTAILPVWCEHDKNNTTTDSAEVSFAAEVADHALEEVKKRFPNLEGVK